MKLYYAKSSFISSDLYPMQYGEQQCDAGYAFGPAVRNFYLIHYVYSGKGTLYINHSSFDIHAGQFFLIPPKQTAYYKADDHDPWLYRWIEFDGSFSEKILSAAGFSKEEYVLSDDTFIGDALTAIIESGWSDFATVMSYFWRFIAALTNGNLQKNDENTAATYVSNAKSFIRSNLYRKITVTEIAQFLNIDRSHLTRCFQSVSSMSTQQFIISLKMEAASQYLKKNNLTIKEIASSVGYDNQMEFSKQFKKYYHMTPTQWRATDNYQQSINAYVAIQ